MHNEAQRPKRTLVKRNQTLAFLGAFALYLLNAITGRPKGPDISHWENSYDPDKGTETTQFAIMKLTEGTTWIDPLVDQLWQGVRKVAVRGGYHYQRSGMSWAAQVLHFLNIAARYDLHFFAVDLEEYGNTYNDTFFADTRRIIDEVRARTGKKVLLYSNISTYTLFAAAIKRLYPDAQAWLDALEFWIAWPSTTATTPLLPTGRSTWKFWQVSWTETSYGTGAPCDLNVFNGTNDQLLEWAGISQSTNDTIKYPFEGITRLYGTRLNCKIIATIIETDKIKHAEVRCEFDYPSVVCKRYNADLFFNGDDWSKTTLQVKGLAVSNGTECNPRTNFNPSLIFHKNNSATIFHETVNDEWNVTSGLRYIIRDGKIPDYLYGNETQYTERHARALWAITRGGKVIRLSVDGDYTHAGVTLLEGAKIIIDICNELGIEVLHAFDGGGGGDMIDGIQGKYENTPDDEVNGIHYERKVPQTILIYANKETQPMSQYEVTTKRTNMSLRSDHNTGASKIGTVANAETVLLADEIWTAPVDLYNSAGVQINKVGDKWAHLVNENAWIAITHLAVVYCTYTDLTPVPTPIDKKPVSVMIDLAPGSIVTIKYEDGTTAEQVA